MKDIERRHGVTGITTERLSARRKRKRKAPSTRGKINDEEIYHHLKDGLPPNTDPRKGVVEAYFCTAAEAKTLMRSAGTAPIITEGQQAFEWSEERSPIDQLFKSGWLTDLERTVSVQIPSASSEAESYEVHNLREVYDKFKSGVPDDDPWNVLDMGNPLPDTTYPKFLDDLNCQLLTQIRNDILNEKSGQREAVPARNARYWKDLLSWVLLSQGGNNTGTHTDSHGLSTWISIQQGHFGFGWIANPTPREREAWADNHFCNSGKFRYVVLKPGQAIRFPPGTIHSVFRWEDTFAIGGHTLLWSEIKQWLRTMKWQQLNPDTTNEDMTKESISFLTKPVFKFVKWRVREGMVDDIGGLDEAEAIMAAIKVSDYLWTALHITYSENRIGQNGRPTSQDTVVDTATLLLDPGKHKAYIRALYV
ncbi:hypothetical protein B0J13DRAFT_457480 [Dactylonectria estremocensis]|uniref:JmjC domain-containing protein n=1 Tax=Dactylonectria estremocensis TaxID=1079267 RepID=A0A9P9DK87_9HYPO|nr:hypothetical protein B0J13DRAFT_457480 [Dactylonectria estremocensis]